MFYDFISYWRKECSDVVLQFLSEESYFYVSCIYTFLRCKIYDISVESRLSLPLLT